MTEISAGKAIKHRRNTDVVFLIRQVITTDYADAIVHGAWHNITTAKPFLIGPDTVYIHEKDFKDWNIYPFRE